jgi:hypothetical protein
MSYGGSHFCVNLMPTSCWSVHLSIECIWNFRRTFLSNYSSQMLENIAHSFFWHALWWDSFFCESDADFLFICAFVRRVYMKYCVFRIFVAVFSATTHCRCFKFQILTHSFFWHAIWWDSWLCESDANFLFIRASVHRVCMKFPLQFLQQLLIADAWNFSTLFILACQMVGFIFSRIRC